MIEFTSEEITLAEILIDAGVRFVERTAYGDLIWESHKGTDFLPPKLFPSVFLGERVWLGDIVQIEE